MGNNQKVVSHTGQVPHRIPPIPDSLSGIGNMSGMRNSQKLASHTRWLPHRIPHPGQVVLYGKLTPIPGKYLLDSQYTQYLNRKIYPICNICSIRITKIQKQNMLTLDNKDYSKICQNLAFQGAEKLPERFKSWWEEMSSIITIQR